MRVFLSWSGERSRDVAEALEAWLRPVVQAVEPWISVDIEKGARWSPEISALLEESRVGIICLTPENLESRWIHFETGALSKTKDSRVCPFLLDLSPSQVPPPLGLFQLTTTEKGDIERLVRTINAAVGRDGEKAVEDSLLSEIFETYWPRLDEKLRKIAASRPPHAAPTRSQESILEEIVTTVRSIERRQAATDHERHSADALREAIAREVLSERQAMPRRVEDIIQELAKRLAEDDGAQPEIA